MIRRVTFDGRPNEMQCESVRFDIGVLVTMTTKPSIPNREVNARIHKKAKTKQKKNQQHTEEAESHSNERMYSLFSCYFFFFFKVFCALTHTYALRVSRGEQKGERPRRCRTRTTEREWQRWNCCRVWACARARVCVCYSCAASGMLSSCGHTYTRSNWRAVALVCA